MKKGKLIKEGKYWKIQNVDDQKITPVFGDFGLPEDGNGMEVEFDNTGGPIKKIAVDGKEYIKKDQPASGYQKPVENNFRNESKSNVYDQLQQRSANYKQSVQREEARAPYNFVPLNERIVKGQSVPPDFSNYHHGRLSGYINLEITTRTPLFIRGENEGFIKINDRPVIPGSSLRGLTRTLVEIVSFGKFINCDDKTLYFRKSGRNAASNRKMGFLNFDTSTNKYIINQATSAAIPLYYKSSKSNEFDYQFVFSGVSFMVNIYAGTMGKNNFQIAYSKNSVKYDIDEAIIRSYKNDDNRNAGKEMKDLIESINKSTFKNKLIAYNSSTGKSILYIGIPVWYEINRINGKDEVIHFGHCRNYRVPYAFSIRNINHIPNELQNPKITDFAESMFGTTEKAGRVYFEDATFEFEQPDHSYEPLVLQILSGPKPTTYQHYLEQKPLGKNTPESQLSKWGYVDTPIRGYKLYWHRNTPDNKHEEYSWAFDDDDKEDFAKKKKLLAEKKTKPVKRAIKFQSCIRFDNLTREELGCLLFVLKLPDGCFHKLGMGKPLGLGSVEIKPELTIINRKDRYTSLFKDNSWNKAEKKQEDILHYQNAFAAYIGEELGVTLALNTEWESLWNDKRLKELRAMLQWDHKGISKEDWIEKTRYMEIERKQYREDGSLKLKPNGSPDTKNEYADKKVLPTPIEVKEK